MNSDLSVVMLGSSGAVGGEAARALVGLPGISQLTLLGRRRTEGVESPLVAQHLVDALDPATYAHHLPGHLAAVCTLGVGEPSKVSKEQFVRIDKQAVLDFAGACKEAGVQHFELLSSVGTDSSSRSFFLRTKGELEDGLRALRFERLSLFHPSMILTEHNRYGFSQAVTLAVWPLLTPLLCGPLRKARGIPVAKLGRAMAHNLVMPGQGEETLEWDDFIALNA